MINLFLLLNHSIILVHEGTWKIFICILMEVVILCTLLVLFFSLCFYIFFLLVLKDFLSHATRSSGFSQ